MFDLSQMFHRSNQLPYYQTAAQPKIKQKNTELELNVQHQNPQKFEKIYLKCKPSVQILLVKKLDKRQASYHENSLNTML